MHQAGWQDCHQSASVYSDLKALYKSNIIIIITDFTMSSKMLNRCDRTCLLDACPHFHDKQTDLIFVCSVLFQIFVGWLSSYQDLFVCCRVQLGKSRMKVPCRSVTCDHLQCFDAVTYLRMNEKKPTWFCPVCDRHAEYSKLIVDGFVA